MYISDIRGLRITIWCMTVVYISVSNHSTSWIRVLGQNLADHSGDNCMDTAVRVDIYTRYIYVYPYPVCSGGPLPDLMNH